MVERARSAPTICFGDDCFAGQAPEEAERPSRCLTGIPCLRLLLGFLHALETLPKRRVDFCFRPKTFSFVKAKTIQP